MNAIFYKNWNDKWVRDLVSNNDSELQTRLLYVRKHLALNGQCDIFKDVPNSHVFAYYTRVFQIGHNYHRVELFSKYGDGCGCMDSVAKYESGRMSEIIKHVRNRLTTKQLKTLKSIMKDRQDGISMPDGTFENN